MFSLNATGSYSLYTADYIYDSAFYESDYTENETVLQLFFVGEPCHELHFRAVCRPLKAIYPIRFSYYIMHVIHISWVVSLHVL